MAKYFLIGKYSSEALKGISKARTDDAVKIINDNGGKVDSMYVLLGEKDLVLIVDFPDIEKVVKASISLSQKTNIAFSTSPAVPVDEFDKLLG